MSKNTNHHRATDRTQAADTAEISLRTSYDEARKMSAVPQHLAQYENNTSERSDKVLAMTGKRKAHCLGTMGSTLSLVGIPNTKMNSSTRERTSKDFEEESATSYSSSTDRVESVERAATVTATTTTSSGEDHDSSGGNSGTAPGAASSSSGSQQRGHDEQTRSAAAPPVHASQHRSHGRRRPLEEVTTSDSMGLPLSADCQIEAQVEKHAVVLAHHLPPPCMHPSSSDGEHVEYSGSSLIPSHREPAFHTIRRTFDRFARPEGATSPRASSPTMFASARVRGDRSGALSRETRGRLRCSEDHEASGSEDAAGSSGSGMEEGYAGSESSNGPRSHSNSSQSISSSEPKPKKRTPTESKVLSGNPKRPMLIKRIGSNHSMSSDIADFSSSESGNVESFTLNVLRESPAGSPSISSSDGSEEEFDARPRLKRVRPAAMPSQRHRHLDEVSQPESAEKGPQIVSLGCDVMAHVLTFLEPPEILDVLTMPLSKSWLEAFARQQELWRVLCLLPPFLDQVDAVDDDSSDESISSFPFDTEDDPKTMFGKYRLTYTSFVRCMRYLARIKDDASNGRPPSVDIGPSYSVGGKVSSNQSLQQFLRRARGVVSRSQDVGAAKLKKSEPPSVVLEVAEPVGLADDGSSVLAKRVRPRSSGSGESRKKAKFGHSSLTQRLLGPAGGGAVGNQDLPWSCAIYSIVNWMAAYQDVEGIQTMCLKVLPFLLENEQQRMTAQRAGLTDIVLRAMLQFKDSVQLHTAAFHTIVLLARPLGGREGMLFHTSMVNSSGIFSAAGDFQNRKNGIAIMLDSIQRFGSNEVLQAMSCWSLVNVALVPAQKEVLVRLGGIDVTVNAMTEHPYSAEVQFRALFALINLVIPAAAIDPNASDSRPLQEQQEEETEAEVLGAMVNKVVELVVLSMKNFCSSEAILNRACLVLHNLSLSPQYHRALLCTPNCYQMLEWCLANYLTDQVLQQSAAGTLHRLQNTLSTDDSLRSTFNAAQRAQHQSMLEQAHQEAILLHEQFAPNEQPENA